MCRIDVIAMRAVCDEIIDFLRRETLPDHHVTACVETVDVVRVGHFDACDSQTRDKMRAYQDQHFSRMGEPSRETTVIAAS